MAFISAKLAAYFLMLAILSFLLYAAQFLFAFSLYGIGNLDVALQSLSEYRNCVLPVSIGTYIWLFLEIKVAACLVFGSLIVFFMITWKRFVPAVCSYFWVMLIEYVLYTTVNSLSKWNWFRYVNLFSILDASQPFTVLLEFKFVFLSNLVRVCKDGSMYCNDSFVYRAFDFDLLS